MTTTGRQKAAVRRTEAIERRPVAAGTATEIQVLVGPADGAPNFALCVSCHTL